MNWTALDAKFSDGLNIPPCLRLSDAVRRKAWVGRPVRETQMIPVEPARDKELRDAAEAERKLRSLAKLRAAVDKKKRRDAPPADFNPVDYRWNQRKNCYERNPLAFLYKPAPVLVEQQKLMEVKDLDRPRSRSDNVPSPSVKSPGRASATDDLGARVTAALEHPTFAGSLKRFAKANGCWNDKYDKFPNPGLIRMNVVNRLRAKVRKGHKTVWK